MVLTALALDEHPQPPVSRPLRSWPLSTHPAQSTLLSTSLAGPGSVPGAYGRAHPSPGGPPQWSTKSYCFFSLTSLRLAPPGGPFISCLRYHHPLTHDAQLVTYAKHGAYPFPDFRPHVLALPALDLDVNGITQRAISSSDLWLTIVALGSATSRRGPGAPPLLAKQSPVRQHHSWFVFPGHLAASTLLLRADTCGRPFGISGWK